MNEESQKKEIKINEEIKKEEIKIIEENKKEEIKNEDNKKEENKKIEEINNIEKKDENNINNDNNINSNNQEAKRHDYSMETREEDINKFNSGNNSQILNNNSSMANLNINNTEEQLNINDIIDEKDEEKQENIYPIETGLFEKSFVPTKIYSVLKLKSELSTIKHKIINIQQKIRLREEEIEEIRSKAKMKNIIFQSNLLGSKMITLHRMKSKNKEIEETSILMKNRLRENLKKELEYYTNFRLRLY